MPVASQGQRHHSVADLILNGKAEPVSSLGFDQPGQKEMIGRFQRRKSGIYIDCFLLFDRRSFAPARPTRRGRPKVLHN